MSIQENKEIVRRLAEEVWNEHNLEKVGDFVGGEQLEESIPGKGSRFTRSEFTASQTVRLSRHGQCKTGWVFWRN
jgi:hypothetical protein